MKPNPAIDPVPFGRWTLRDEAAQRRSPSTLGVSVLTEMKSFLKTAGLALAILFVPVLVFVRYMEASNRFDALGWWYSLYGTLAFSVPAALVVASFLFIIAKNRGDGSV